MVFNLLPHLEIFGSLALLPCSAICLIMWQGGEIDSFWQILSSSSLLNFRGGSPPTDSPKVNCWGMYSWSRQEAIISSGVLRNCSFLYFRLCVQLHLCLRLSDVSSWTKGGTLANDSIWRKSSMNESWKFFQILFTQITQISAMCNASNWIQLLRDGMLFDSNLAKNAS